MAQVRCEKCDKVGNYTVDGYRQVVTKLEQGQDWCGDLAVLCRNCQKDYKADSLEMLADGRAVSKLSKMLRTVKGWISINVPALEQWSAWKPRLGEGERVLFAEKALTANRQERADEKARGFVRPPRYSSDT